MRGKVLHKKYLQVNSYWTRLREPVPSVNLLDRTLIKDIKDKLYSYLGITEVPFMGLSGTQIGVYHNCSLLRFRGERNHRLMFNLSVVRSFGSFNSKERCMSEPAVMYSIKRPIVLRASWFDEFGKEHKRWLFGRNAAIFSHECDHQSGVLIKDKGVELRCVKF